MQVILSHDEVMDAINEFVQAMAFFKSPGMVQIEIVAKNNEIMAKITQFAVEGEK